MDRFNILLVFLLCATVSGQQDLQNGQDKTSYTQTEYSIYGVELDALNSLPEAEMAVLFSEITVNDTLAVKFEGEVTQVCQAKGCWMKVALEDGQQVMVTFKDYAFFVPKDITGKHIVANGIAFVEEMSVADQQHFARDSGMGEAAIAEIKSPRKSYRFEADGVLIAN